jgi:hypothetical protein
VTRIGDHDLFTPQSFERYCNLHHVFKTTEDMQQFIADRTPKQARQDEFEEQQEQAENAETDARNARYLKEKCPTCAEKCYWFKKISQNDQIFQLPVSESLKI